MMLRVVKRIGVSAWITIPLLLAVGLLRRRIGKQPVVVIDHWWNVNFATTGCEMRRKLNDACVRDVAAEVGDFEGQIATHFARSGDCRDVILRTAGANNINPKVDLLLTVNFSSGDPSQSWSVVRPADSKLITGQNTPDEIAEKVCMLAKQTAMGESEWAAR
jgi:hypothetical protein